MLPLSAGVRVPPGALAPRTGLLARAGDRQTAFLCWCLGGACLAALQHIATLKIQDPMYTAVMEFDPVPSHAYNASHHSLRHSIACGKERERTWLFLKE